MKFINVLSSTSDCNKWLANTRHPRILHVFDHACNLINERREVLSVVTPQIGNGPFNLVIGEDVLFSGHLHAQAPIAIHGDQLHIGDLAIHTAYARLWSPHPDWERLHAWKGGILNQLISLPMTNYQPSLPASLLSTFTACIAIADIRFSVSVTQNLAGLGIGLTPAGDDFMMGAIYAAWIIHPPEVARDLAEGIVNVTMPMTTSLSVAWLKSAGKGEAGILWHEFFEALVSDNMMVIQESMNKLLMVGHTSGADALAGFMGVFKSFKEIEVAPCPS